jgi:hypothetical protein
MVGLASRLSLENTISYNPTFVNAAMICWPGRLDRGEALNGTMLKSKKSLTGRLQDVILLAAVHQTLVIKFMIRKALPNATLEESLGDTTNHSSNRLRRSVAKHLEHCVEFLRQSLVGLAGLAPQQFVEKRWSCGLGRDTCTVFREQCHMTTQLKASCTQEKR